MIGHPAHAGGLFHSLLQQRQGLSDAPRQGIGTAQARRHPGQKGSYFHALAEVKAPFEHRNSLVEVPFSAVKSAESDPRPDKTVRVIDRLGHPHRFLRACDTLSKPTQVSKAIAQDTTGKHGKTTRHAEALSDVLAC